MERITTTERHAELPSKALIKATAQAIHEYRNYGLYSDRSSGYPSSMEHEAECLLREIEPLIRKDERVRVVEGLVATIKALDGGRSRFLLRDQVLAVVEAAK